jgi:hypothetical protein
VAKQAERGSTFNQFFPKSVKSYKGYEVIPAQEKKGFAEYKVKDKAGKTVALLSISDTTSVPSAALKYQNATEKIAGYPAVDQGVNATGILVNGYQVKVLSRDVSFKKADRVAWLQQFNLKELAQLKPALLPPTAKTAPAINPAPATAAKAPAYSRPAAKNPPVLTPQPAG